MLGSSTNDDNNTTSNSSANPDLDRSNLRKNGDDVLDGVVVCLSGLEPDLKNRLHDTVTSLGGTFLRQFNPEFVTHLVLDEPMGPKYEFVMNCKKMAWEEERARRARETMAEETSASALTKLPLTKASSPEWAKRIFVVTSSWIEACHRQGRRVSESDYLLEKNSMNFDDDDHGLDVSNMHNNDDKLKITPTELDEPLEEACRWMLQSSQSQLQQPSKTIVIPRLFSCRSFLLLGFDTDQPFSYNKNSISHAKTRAESTNISVKELLSKLIRRAGGTIYWEPNEFISIIVVQAGYTKEVWNDVRYFCRHHPRGPIAVTPKWILQSLHSGTFHPPPFLPEPILPQLQRPNSTSKNRAANNCQNAQQIQSNIENDLVTRKSTIFRGHIFAVVKLKPPPGTIDFPMAEIQAIITNGGGILMNKQIFEAIKTDLKKNAAHKKRMEDDSFDANDMDDEGSKPNKKFYVVSTGGYHLDHANFCPLLSDLEKLGVDIIPVNPIWVLTCASEETECDPAMCPLLFQPQTWPYRLLPPSNSASSATDGNPATAEEGRRFLISVTGFVDMSRYGIIQLLKSIGATYTDSLRAKNTHLICKEATGKKFIRALEWRMHVISVDWLYHVVRYGYKDGCEDMFTLDETRGPVKTMTAQNRRAFTKEVRLDCDKQNPPLSKSGEKKANERNVDALFDGNVINQADDGDSHDMNEKDEAMSSDKVISNHGVTKRRKKKSEDHKRRIQSALSSLQTTSTTWKSKQCELQRRTLRRHEKPIATSQTKSLDSESVLVDDDLSLSLSQSCSGVESHVPLSQPGENYDESQVVWFPAGNG